MQTQALHTQQRTKYFSFAWSEKSTKLSFCLSGLSSPTVLCTLNYLSVQCYSFVKFMLYLWLIHMYTVMCPVCTAGFAGAIWDIANCNLATVQPQPISPHCCLILSVPTFQIQREKTSEFGKMSRVHWAHVVIVVLLSLVQTAPQRLDEWQARDKCTVNSGSIEKTPPVTQGSWRN